MSKRKEVRIVGRLAVSGKDLAAVIEELGEPRKERFLRLRRAIHRFLNPPIERRPIEFNAISPEN